jgi:hypothetical protein
MYLRGWYYFSTYYTLHGLDWYIKKGGEGGTLRGLRIKRVCRYFNPPQTSVIVGLDSPPVL